MVDVMIDEFVVFSDHHAHTFPFGAKEEAYENYFVNSRLKASYDVVAEIQKYVASNNIKKVFFCGDLFHTREAVPTVALNLMHRAISSLASVARVWMMPGNHDYADRDGKIHSLEVFKRIDGCRVIDWNTPSDTPGLAPRTLRMYGLRKDAVTYSFVPYTDDRQQAAECIATAANSTLPNEPHILFAHLGIQGAKVGSDYVLVSDNDVSVSDIPWQKFAGCFFGHYHEHQQLFKNGWYVGATHQHNWGDANTKRGFLHVKVYLDHVDFDFVETKSAPKFILSKEGSQTKPRPMDFVRILTSKKHTPAEIDSLRQSSGAENCEVIYMPPEVQAATLELSEENLSPVAMVPAWVKANEAWVKSHLPGIEKSDLVTYGKTLLVVANAE
ncbi:MAG: hypothetical protein EBS53_00575 [Bacteroidetes bacterium]|nr:hypothetical protein [Bacteroidota bacterium]